LRDRLNIKARDFDIIMAVIKITSFGIRSNATTLFDSYKPSTAHICIFCREYKVRASHLRIYYPE
jgi:hypothetical protein